MMINTQFRRVGLYDPTQQIEVSKFDQGESNVAYIYPRWFIELLVGQNRNGYVIQFHVGTEKWYLRNPDGPDYVIENDDYVAMDRYGEVFVVAAKVIDSMYRLWDHERDEPTGIWT